MALAAAASSGSLSASAVASAGNSVVQAVTMILKEWGTAFLLMSPQLHSLGASLNHYFGASMSSGLGLRHPSSGLGPAGGKGDAAAGAAAEAAGSGAGLTVLQLREKDTATKVDALFRLQLFDTAAAVASGSGYDKDGLAEIHRAHAEWLYSQGDYDGLIACYARTIGVLEPSHVVRHFLDSSRIGNLAVYLQALHAAGCAGSDHATLLLNCYTKLRRTFIRGEIGGGGGASTPPAGSSSSSRALIKAGPSLSSSSSLPSGTRHLSFDVPTAIAALRESGCAEEALYLASVHGNHDAYMQITLELGRTKVAAAREAMAARIAARRNQLQQQAESSNGKQQPSLSAGMSKAASSGAISSLNIESSGIGGAGDGLPLNSALPLCVGLPALSSLRRGAYVIGPLWARAAGWPAIRHH